MNNLKDQLHKSFRAEMMASGLYKKLSNQYKKRNPDLSKRLIEIAGQEHMHGRLFRQYHKKVYGKEIRGETIWIAVGKLVAYLLVPLSLESKIQKLSCKELEAVVKIENQLLIVKEPSLLKVLKTILPDEKAHANLYNDFFKGE
jgi:rubrerythrin